MLLAYGHAEIEWRGGTYRLSPSFVSIAKLGSPVEIVELFKSFFSPGAAWHKFNIAVCVLNACSDKPIPEKLTGFVKFSERQQRFMYHQPSHNMPMFDDVITLAGHCLTHGICGRVESDGIEGEPLKEFDAYEFIELAQKHLKVSITEASEMTMTQFVRRMRMEYPPEVDDSTATDMEESALFASFEEAN